MIDVSNGKVLIEIRNFVTRRSGSRITSAHLLPSIDASRLLVGIHILLSLDLPKEHALEDISLHRPPMHTYSTVEHRFLVQRDLSRANSRQSVTMERRSKGDAGLEHMGSAL